MDARRKAILGLAQHYHYDAEHANQVECLAGSLFIDLQQLHGLDDEDRKFLEYAAILHDIGSYLGARGHHRNTLQLIMMEPLMEFSREEKTFLANIARYHRKSHPNLNHTAFALLSEENQKKVWHLAPILRIADALDRSHKAPVNELQCELADDALILHIGASGDMMQEEASLNRRGDLFREVYGREVRLNLRPVRIMNAEPPDLTASEETEHPG